MLAGIKRLEPYWDFKMVRLLQKKYGSSSKTQTQNCLPGTRHLHF